MRRGFVEFGQRAEVRLYTIDLKFSPWMPCKITLHYLLFSCSV